MNPLDPASTALLIMDVQAGILPRVPEPDAFVARIAETLGQARAAGVHIGYVRVGFEDAEYDDVPPHSSFAALAAIPEIKEMMRADGPGTQIDERVAPRDGDIVVRKRRVGPFTTTDLQAQLDVRGITTLLLTGISTSGVVLSTIRQAVDLDYRVVVIADEVADADEEVHRVLVEKVFPRQGEVVTSADVAAALA
jgi:nicotinamidase-related amidase